MDCCVLVCNGKAMFMKGEMTASVCRLNTDRSSEYKLLNE